MVLISRLTGGNFLKMVPKFTTERLKIGSQISFLIPRDLNVSQIPKIDYKNRKSTIRGHKSTLRSPKSGGLKSTQRDPNLTPRSPKSTQSGQIVTPRNPNLIPRGKKYTQRGPK